MFSFLPAKPSERCGKSCPLNRKDRFLDCVQRPSATVSRLLPAPPDWTDSSPDTVPVSEWPGTLPHLDANYPHLCRPGDGNPKGCPPSTRATNPQDVEPLPATTGKCESEAV